MTNTPTAELGAALDDRFPSADERPRARILLAVTGENRRLLGNWLSDELGYEVVDGGPDAADPGSIDACVCDIPALRRHGEAFATNKRAAEPVHLPYLLLVPEREVRSKQSDLWAGVGELFPPGVDDILLTPTSQVELGRRLEALLHARQLSLQLRTKAAELESQRRINAVIREINGVLVRARSREEIVHEVCDRLAEAEPYTFAWFGEMSATARTVRVRAHAGGGRPPPETVTGVDEGPDLPAKRALSTREVVTAQPAELIRAASDGNDSLSPWPRWMRERGFGALISVPIDYGDTVYGVLEVYADRSAAFDEPSAAVFAELGSTVGYAINGVETKRLIQSERLTQVTFRIEDETEFLVGVSEETGATLRLNGIVPAAEGTTLEYFAIAGADPGAVVERAAAFEAVCEGDVVREGETEGVVKLVVEDDVLASIGDAGATLGDVTVADGTITVTAVLSQESDVRAFAQGVLSNYGGAELLTQRQVDRDDVTELEFRQSFERALTERQRSVLEAAYRAGYFNRPRASTGEEIADSLGISAATFHQHVRTSERKLLESFFE